MTIQLKRCRFYVFRRSCDAKTRMYPIILVVCHVSCEGLVIVKVAYCCHDVICYSGRVVPRNHVALRVG